jgi:hypothetical protein
MRSESLFYFQINPLLTNRYINYVVSIWQRERVIKKELLK